MYWYNFYQINYWCIGMFCLYKAFEKDNVFSTMGKIFVCLAVARQYMGMRAGEDGFHF